MYPLRRSKPFLSPYSRAWRVIVFALAATGCTSTDAPNVPEGIAVISGNDQYATVGSAAANQLVVRVLDQSGNSFSGATVSWVVSAGGGTVSDSTSVSDANGYATMTYTAGAAPGVATVVATVGQVWTTSFTIYVQPPSNVIRIR